MEEKIIEILQKQVYNLPDEKGHSIEVMEACDIPASAKEISALFREFIEWKDDNVGKPSRDGLYLYWEDRFNLDELFDYWWNNIKKQVIWH